MFGSILKKETTQESRMNQKPAMTPVLNQCSVCEHFNRETGATCPAFPDGIPVIIILGVFDHTFPYNRDGETDHGILFKPIDKLS